jgi:hypothetical protein
VSGDDLIAEGYQPGPQFKQMLGAVEDAQLDGKLGNKTDALSFLRRHFPQPARLSS